MRKNIIYSIGIIILIFVGIMFSKGLITGYAVSKSITLGYCPTMSSLAEEIASKNSHISLQPFDYTAEALQSLNNGDIDLVLVGRLAKKDELNNAFEKWLGEGLTLVGREKKIVHISQLQNNRIYTAVDEKLANEYLPHTENIIFHESTESAIREGMNDIILIDWKDYTDNLELVIPIDDLGNKIEKFRIPVLYSYDDANIKNLEV